MLHAPSFEARDNIYVADAIDGLLYMCQYGAAGHAYNISSCGENGNCATIDEISRKLVEIAHQRGRNLVQLVSGPDIAHTPGIMLDNTPLKTLGWKITTSLTQGLEQTFDEIAKTQP